MVQICIIVDRKFNFKRAHTNRLTICILTIYTLYTLYTLYSDICTYSWYILNKNYKNIIFYNIYENIISYFDKLV